MDHPAADHRDWNFPFPTASPATAQSMRQPTESSGADFRRPSIPKDESSVFFRMVLSSVLHDKKLKIPGKFSKNIMNEFPAVATLKTPDNCTLTVGLRMIDGKIWFVDGLSEFFRHHSIRAGYLLVFTYEGQLNFSVQIYNVAAAEIKYQCGNVSSFEGVNSGKRRNKEDAQANDRAEMLNSLPPWQSPMSLRNNIFDGSSGQQKLGKSDDPLGIQNSAKSHYDFDLEDGVTQSSDKPRYGQYAEWNFNGSEPKTSKTSGGSTRDIGIQCDFSELVTSAYKIRMNSLNERPEKPRKRKKGKGSSEPESSVKQEREMKTPENDSAFGTLMRKWRVVTPEEKERVLNVAKMFQSENPFCRVILKRSYVYKGIGLHMPSSFAEKYLSGVSGFVMLQVSNGEKWPVRCLWRGGSAKLSKGWPEFVSGNKLEEGDACVFELMNTGEVVLRVTIIRVAEVAGPVNQLLHHQQQPNQLINSRLHS